MPVSKRKTVSEIFLVFLTMTVTTVLYCALEFYLPPGIFSRFMAIRNAVGERIADWISRGIV